VAEWGDLYFGSGVQRGRKCGSLAGLPLLALDQLDD
jgi:hypothetical protein